MFCEIRPRTIVYATFEHFGIFLRIFIAILGFPYAKNYG